MLTTLWIGKADKDSQILTFQQILLPQCKPHQKVCMVASIKIQIIKQNNSAFSSQLTQNNH